MSDDSDEEVVSFSAPKKKEESKKQTESQAPSGHKTWADFGRMFVNESAKGAMDTIAAPFRYGWDAGRKDSTPEFHDSIAGGMARGVPIARNFIPETEQDRQFQQNYPNAEKYANLSGEALPALATSGLGAPVNSGIMQLLKYGATQGAANAGIGAADRATSDLNAPLKDVAAKAVSGIPQDAAFGFAGPMAGRALSPFARPATETLDNAIWRGATAKKATEGIDRFADKFDPAWLRQSSPMAAMAAEMGAASSPALAHTLSALAGASIAGPAIAKWYVNNNIFGPSGQQALNTAVRSAGNNTPKEHKKSENKIEQSTGLKVVEEE